MFRWPSRCALFAVLLSCCAASAQLAEMNAPGGGITALDAIGSARLDLKIFQMDSFDPRTTEIQSPDGSVSWLDIKAPERPRREYQKGRMLLMRRHPEDAIEFLNQAIAWDPQFFAAHNALGTAYLDMGDYRRAKSEFATAAALDGHLPNSYLNLGCAELDLRQYAQAEDSLRQAARLAPLDAQLKLALIYAEFLNHHYSAVLATSRQARWRKDDGADLAHLFIAGAWLALGHPAAAEQEINVLLSEDSASPFAPQFRRILKQIQLEDARSAPASLRAGSASSSVPSGGDVAGGTPATTFHMDEDEVGLQFAALNLGQSVTDLTASDVTILDDHRPPGAILQFRNETRLPLRLGFVIDTSNSVVNRFSYEQASAFRFLNEVLTGKDDLAFVVGFNSTVLLAQDFTSNPDLVAHAVDQLAPGGSTALRDAVAFAVDKLEAHPESGPVARVLVVISDGEDNESRTTLKQVTEIAQRAQVAIYTIGTSAAPQGNHAGEPALKTLSELTGGAIFLPQPYRGLNPGFARLQQILRGRYLVAYRPAGFERDGRYRSIDIEARKDGRKLLVFARKGYFASAPAPGP